MKDCGNKGDEIGFKNTEMKQELNNSVTSCVIIYVLLFCIYVIWINYRKFSVWVKNKKT